MPQIEIVVPTYNAALWLDEFFESVLAQESLDDFRIIARDDASQDTTPDRLAAWQKRLGDRMQILPTLKNLGMVGNYGVLFEATSAPWVMLGDPDDVWLPKKMTICISMMREAEREYGSACPIAIFTDALVVDASLSPISSSYWKWMRQNPMHSREFSRLLLDDPALTSTMIVNRALLKLVVPFSGAAVYPDWLLALAACCFGRLTFSIEKTVKYRRHSSNDSVTPSSANLLHALRGLGQARKRVHDLIVQSSAQAKKFLYHFEGQIPSEHIPTLRAVENLPHSNFLDSRRSIIRHDLWFGSNIKNVGFMIFL